MRSTPAARIELAANEARFFAHPGFTDHWESLRVLDKPGPEVMPARNVNLTDHFDRLIDARDDSGRFSNASEVVRAGLELRDLEDKLKWRRSACAPLLTNVSKIWNRVATRRNFCCGNQGLRSSIERPSLDRGLVRAERRLTKRPPLQVRITRAASLNMVAVMRWTLR